MVAILAAVGLATGCASMRPTDEQVSLATPAISPSAPPTVTPTRGAIVANDATSPLPTPSKPASQTSTPTPQPSFEGPFVYGTSSGGRPLMAYRLGTGPSVRAIIGGIHGGYEWNTIVLVSETLTHLQQNPTLVPQDITLYIIPCANPDGYAAGTDLEHGRVNGNDVDLNRNWGYHWQPTATHGTRPVNAGTRPFSEPETAALRDFILDRNVTEAIFYHSAMARIFYGAERDCSATYQLAQEVSDATGYPISAGVAGQTTTGDAVDWMSARGLAGIEVELTTHEDVEWERNLQGVRAFLHWTPPPSPAPLVQTTHIGTSVQGQPIEVTRVGLGDRGALVIVGGIHGDQPYTEALVRSLMEQYTNTPELVPFDFTVRFLPAMNPDGLAAGTRPNANGVDLNRNWPTDDWQADATHAGRTVLGSGGTAPASEPEVQAVVGWLLEDVRPAVQQVWLLAYHSLRPPYGAVQPGYTVRGTPGFHARQLAQRVADLSGYTYLSTWPAEHPLTGELIHWCDSNDITAIDVMLPSQDSPGSAFDDVPESMIETHQRVLGALMQSFEDASPPPDDADYILYTVQPGDTLLDIAFRFEVETEAAQRLVEEIVRLNTIADEDHLEAGQQIRIPAMDGEQ
jgi:murein tripeptide amidase MpaA